MSKNTLGKVVNNDAYELIKTTWKHNSHVIKETIRDIEIEIERSTLRYDILNSDITNKKHE